MNGWGDSSKLLVVHDNAESILSEPAGTKVRCSNSGNAGEQRAGAGTCLLAWSVGLCRRADASGLLALQAFLDLLNLLSTGRRVFQVVTTRELPGDKSETLRQLPQLPLGPLERPDAIVLLRQRCPRVAVPDADAAAVAGVCEGNALLLTLMGSFLEDERCTVKASAGCAGTHACELPGRCQLNQPAQCNHFMVSEAMCAGYSGRGHHCAR